VRFVIGGLGDVVFDLVRRLVVHRPPIPSCQQDTHALGNGTPSKHSLEQQNMRLRLMHLVVFPPQTLSPTSAHTISHPASPSKSSFAETRQD